MVFFGGGIDPNSARDLAHANGMGGRIPWGRILSNVAGVEVALEVVAILFTQFRG
jgi:hypothetical protein